MASCDSCGVPVSEGARFCPDCAKPKPFLPPRAGPAPEPPKPMSPAARARLLQAGVALIVLGAAMRLALPWAVFILGYWVWAVATGACFCVGALLGRGGLISSPGWVVVPGLAIGFGACAVYNIPRQFESLFRGKTEGATRGNLGALRSALSIYYGDLEGLYPEALTSLTVQGKYLSAIPRAKTPPYHPERAAIRYAAEPDDEGGWLYNNRGKSDPNFGTITVNCTHTDTRGSVWTGY